MLKDLDEGNNMESFKLRKKTGSLIHPNIRKTTSYSTTGLTILQQWLDRTKPSKLALCHSTTRLVGGNISRLHLIPQKYAMVNCTFS